MSRRETNPHFSRPQIPQHQEDHHHPHHHQPPIPFVPHPEHHGQPLPHGGTAPMQRQDPPHRPNFPLPTQHEDHHPLRPHPREDRQPPPISPAPRREERGLPKSKRGGGGRKKQEAQPYLPPQEDHYPLRPRQREDRRPPFIAPVVPHLDQHDQPQLGGGPRQLEDQPYPPPPGKQRVNFQEPSSSPKSPGIPVLPLPDHPPEPRRQHLDPHKQPPHHGRRHRHDIRLPPPKKSNPCTWCGAVFCVIFWLIIIIGGLIVLIVYLVFRPRSPYFDVSSVTLNSAYLDFGYLLNADLTILANFTNPNKKVHVDFSSVTIYLYYGNTVIAAQYVEPFSAARVQSRFANIHMVTSQVQLPLGESQRLVKQMESNGILLQVRGVFRARSKLGSILRYSYNLYGLCNIMVTRPPDGIMLKKKCRTKR